MLPDCQECTGVSLQHWANSSMSLYTGTCQLAGDGVVCVRQNC